MNALPAFAEAVELAETLDEESYAELIALLSRRLAERRRDHIAADIAEGKRAFEAGQCQPMTAEEILAEASR